MESVYDRIKKLSDKQKISVRELGKRLDIGPTTLYKWKTQTPKSDVLMKVADYFNVTTDYLLGRDVKEKNVPEIDKHAKLIAAHIDDDVSEEQMKQITDFIDFLKNKN